MGMTRRTFLSTSSAMVAGAAVQRGAFGANEKVGVCVIGINGRGGGHIRAFTDCPDSEVVALCDVDKRVLERGAAALEKATGKRPKTFVDMRDAFADESINAVSIATPNHWHSLAAVWACQAGKDVYVEKPLAHSYWEGQQLIKAAKKYNRIVQHGTQQRSSGTNLRDMKLMHSGTFIGPIVHARGYVYKNGGRIDIGKGKPGTAPDFLDYNLWLGPAKDRPFMVRQGGDVDESPDEDAGGLFCHYNWHWFWDFGNGESGNQGVHQMDVACWAANKGLPVKVYSTGGRYKWKDDGETPNTQAIDFTYADGTMLTFEVRNLGSFCEGNDANCSNSAFGTDGYWVQGKGFFDYKNKPMAIPADAQEPPTKEGECFVNFIKATKSRKWEDIYGNVEEGFVGCAHIHLGNIAYRLGRSLEFDTAKHAFKKADDATAMLKGHYRDPFVVPEIS
jgi:predicted dehydrogenase